jgi:hypothetical protein
MWPITYISECRLGARPRIDSPWCPTGALFQLKSDRTSAPLGLEPVQSLRRCTSEEDQNGSTKADVKILVRIQGVRTKRSMANLIVSSRPSCLTRCLNMVNGRLTCLNDNPRHCVLIQLKSGHTSAPLWPQA